MSDNLTSTSILTLCDDGFHVVIFLTLRARVSTVGGSQLNRGGRS